MIFNDEIEPALTPDEWNGRRTVIDPGVPGLYAHDPVYLVIAPPEDEYPGGLAVEYVDESCDRVMPLHQHPERVIAFANASLPDDSPYKFTREDANLLSTLAGTVRAEPNTAGVSDDELDAAESRVAWHLRSLAERIESLLPPEPR